MKTIEISGTQYFQFENDLQILPSHGNLSEFMVFDIETLEPKNLNVSSVGAPKFKTSRITIGRTSDWTNFEVRTHLGDSLREGTIVLGYDLSNMNLTGLLEEVVQSGEMSDVIIVKKVYSENEKKRLWNTHKADFQKADKNYDDFLAELEFDPVLRAQIMLLEDEEDSSKAENTKHTEDGNSKIQQIQDDSIAAPKRISKKRAEAAKKKQNVLNNEKKQHDHEEEAKFDVDDRGVKIEEQLNNLNLEDDKIVKVEDVSNNEDNKIENEKA